MKWFFRILVVGLIAFLAMQAVPYGRDNTNPRTVREPRWDSPETRALARSACFDCHSDLTEHPWWSDVAPISWLLQRDVDDGRKVLNFGEWNRPQDTDLAAVVESLQEETMPPWYYRALHPDARLSAEERKALQVGLVRTWTSSPPAK